MVNVTLIDNAELMLAYNRGWIEGIGFAVPRNLA